MPAKRLVVELLNASGEPVPSVTVKVTGPEQGTHWSYTVHCPS